MPTTSPSANAVTPNPGAECRALGCREWVGAWRLFCQAHWRALPLSMRESLIDTWVGQIRGRVTLEDRKDWLREQKRAQLTLELMDKRRRT